MADDQVSRRSSDRNIGSLEEGWEAEFWRRAYGVTRFPLRRATEMLDFPPNQMRERHSDG
jgi:hypothetical protein